VVGFGNGVKLEFGDALVWFRNCMVVGLSFHLSSPRPPQPNRPFTYLFLPLLAGELIPLFEQGYVGVMYVVGPSNLRSIGLARSFETRFI